MSNPLFKNQSRGISFNDFMGKFRQFSGNPMQMLSNLGIPQGMTSPNEIVNYLINSGKINPQQMAQIQNTANAIAQNPMFLNAIKDIKSQCAGL